MNRPWLNFVASIIVGVLVVLSLILAATTLFPRIDAILLTEILFGALVVALVAIGFLRVVRRPKGDAPVDPFARVDSSTWRMPPLSELTRPQPSLVRTVGLVTLRGYLLVAVILAVVKVVQLAIGGAQ